jgi:hypothetical protein
MAQLWSDFASALADPDSSAARIALCREVSGAFTACGNVLWAFGLPITPYRRALAIVGQMAGTLSCGSVSMMDDKNWYAAAALTRQLVEVEYLLFLFADDPNEASRWLSADPDQLRRWYALSAMRKRSAGRFRDGEYWSHCEIGGHPHPKAHFLLPEHFSRDEGGVSSLDCTWLWVDLGQHLERGWGFFQSAVGRDGLSDVGIVAATLPRVTEALSEWHRMDPCADRLTTLPIDGGPDSTK